MAGKGNRTITPQRRLVKNHRAPTRDAPTRSYLALRTRAFIYVGAGLVPALRLEDGIAVGEGECSITPQRGFVKNHRAPTRGRPYKKLSGSQDWRVHVCRGRSCACPVA